MCGRFTLRKDSDALAAHFEVEDVHPLGPRYNIAPTQKIALVRLNPATGRRELVLRRWGLIPPWARGPDPGQAMINARAETLAARPAFREALRRRRCLIPADGFYEWQAVEKRKQPWFIHMPEESLFAFAGLWESTPGEDGARRESCAIITTAPSPALAKVHDRMPAILAPRDYGAWLDANLADATALAPLLAPERVHAAAAGLAFYRVSTAVNRAENETAACIATA